jgi:ABC-type transport system involved in cytochrome c biogenesis permease component
MTARVTFATAARVLAQLRRDPRTLALLLVVPCVLLTILRYAFDGQPETFQRIGPPLIGLVPFIVMFIVASIAMLRERSTGTLERLMSMPVGKLDLLAGYALAFGLLAVVQTALLAALSLGPLDLDTARSPWILIAIALGNALLGMSLGLFVSAFATTEFQAVQFMRHPGRRHRGGAGPGGGHPEAEDRLGLDRGEKRRRHLLLAAHHAGQVEHAIDGGDVEGALDQRGVPRHEQLGALRHDVGDHQREERVAGLLANALVLVQQLRAATHEAADGLEQGDADPPSRAPLVLLGVPPHDLRRRNAAHVGGRLEHLEAELMGVQFEQLLEVPHDLTVPLRGRR